VRISAFALPSPPRDSAGSEPRGTPGDAATGMARMASGPFSGQGAGRRRERSPALARGHAAVHVRLAEHFSNIIHYIAATHPSRRAGPNENGPDVISLF
jgi:hypothetical protein